jgi:hypothetical protein
VHRPLGQQGEDDGANVAAPPPVSAAAVPVAAVPPVPAAGASLAHHSFSFVSTTIIVRRRYIG